MQKKSINEIKKRWKVGTADAGLKDIMAKGLNVMPLTAELLINRGLVDVDRAFCFLNPDLKQLHDPFLLKDMGRAVERVSEAMRKGEKIAVYGDYDVDGITSSALLNLFFREAGVETISFIPDRHKDGYGLNSEAVKKLSAEGAGLIITVDCGSSNPEEIKFAGSLGIDVVVTDHHEPRKDALPAYAFINPKQHDCAFPFKGLAGVGVAFNFVMALRARLRGMGWFKAEAPNLKKYLDLVCIGTIADMVPLLDENRVFVSLGLKELKETGNPGLRALKEVSFADGRAVDAGSVAFQLAPRINAAGRVSSASLALRLLTTADYAEAASIAEALNRDNFRRQRIEEDILVEALQMAGDKPESGIVLYSDKWHAGVIGIVASRLAERFSRPTVLFSVENGVGKGSARAGIKTFDLLNGIASSAQFVDRYGGHRAAAGLTVRAENIEMFKREFLMHLNNTLTEYDLVPEVAIDAMVPLADINLRLATELLLLAPFGVANREPLLCLSDAEILETAVVGTRHLRFKVRQKSGHWTGIGFGLAGLHPISGDGFNVAFSPYVDEWQGKRNVKLKIKDVQARGGVFLEH